MRFAHIIKYQPMYEGIMKKATKKYLSVFNPDYVYWYHEGIVVASSVLVEMDKERVVAVDVQSHEVLKVNGGDVIGIEHAKVLDLNDDGERWEGDVLNNQPYGWGVVYDSENRMVYEGFRLGDVNVCYGRSYYPDVGVIEYEGTICEGKRWGRGVQYSKQGVVMRDGEWVNNEPAEMAMTITKQNQRLFTCVEELVVSDKCCNGMEWRAFDVTRIVHLRELKVGDRCFRNTEELELFGLNELERVVIGKKCFTTCYYEWPRPINPNGHFYLKNCDNLRELNEESGNFCYASLELKSDSEKKK